jgi:hypothetical protein
VEAQVAEDLRSNVVTVRADGQTEILVRFVNPAAIILHGVRLHLAGEIAAAAPSMFAQINDHACALLLKLSATTTNLPAAMAVSPVSTRRQI